LCIHVEIENTKRVCGGGSPSETEREIDWLGEHKAMGLQIHHIAAWLDVSALWRFHVGGQRLRIIAVN
jgi:hypothetical protein